jgi:hypothetical protein
MSYAALLWSICVFGVCSAALVLASKPLIRDVDPAMAESGERLATLDEMLAVSAAFDEMLIRKGLLTGEQLDLIRNGTKSHAVVTGMRTTGAVREDYREVELAVMVRRPGGGQFPAHETTLIPASSLANVSPGSVIDTYYRDESGVAVCVPPS